MQLKDKTQTTKYQEEYVERVNEMLADYEKWIKSYGKLTLGEAWTKRGIRIGTSSGGHPSLILGDAKTKCQPAMNTISGLNALADLPKYRILKVHFHETAFDPTRDAPGVRSIFNARTGQWNFQDWRNGAFVPTRIKDLRNFEAKHEELDRILRCELFAKHTHYEAVMNFENERAHFATAISPYLEKPFSEFLAAEAARWDGTKTKSQLKNGKGGGQSSTPPSKERLAVMEVLTAATQDVVLLIQRPNSNVPVEFLFEAGWDDEKKVQVLNNVQKAAPKTVITIKE